ncbi:single-stranded-DNA-specific exonuclease RecJ [Candidatus Uhrbacteria bacterium]|nr:single-stranded-DNA-specific exonuclease RecJ [Candidatus Uhrbacteria bacterium]
MKKRWRVLSTENALAPEAFPSFHPIATTLLANRGITDALDAEAFFHTDWETGVHDPFLFSRMREAVARVFSAFENGERITVHGDYDADGVTGSTAVITTLREIGSRFFVHGSPPTDTVDYYIPHRDKEGYGLRKETVGLLKERGTSLIITVDCGIACVEEIALAKELGMDVIVLDHHRFGETLPDAFNIHPGLPGETYPFKHLAAVGVSWKFCVALLTEARSRGLEIPDGWDKWLLDLVSIATVTDMVPLVGENRVLLMYGLKVLNKTRRTGLKKLIETSGRTFGEINARDIGFSIGPRINAAGRMDHASVALNLMLSESEEEADRLATDLETHNRNRQKTTEQMMVEADELLVASSKKQEARDEARILVLWSENWAPALVGLVAGRFLERTGKPCVAFGKHGDTWIGSGRSPASYDITEAVKRAGDGLLTRAGGHIQACGFSFTDDAHAPLFAERLRADAHERLSDMDLTPELQIDTVIPLEDVTWSLVETVERFQPFGVGNAAPVFLTRGLVVSEAMPIGNGGKHLRLLLRAPSGIFQKFIGFGMGERLPEITAGSVVDVVYDVGVNEWNGRREIQCKIIDARASQ